MSKSKETDFKKLKQIRIQNMMKWTEEDYEFYNYFFKEFLGEKEIPYLDEVKKLKQKEKEEALLVEESYKRFLKFMEEVKQGKLS